MFRASNRTSKHRYYCMLRRRRASNQFKDELQIMLNEAKGYSNNTDMKYTQPKLML